LRLLRRSQLDEALNVRQPAVAAARAARLDRRRARVEADDARFVAGRHSGSRAGFGGGRSNRKKVGVCICLFVLI
jgi:hypothetical protein